MPRRSAQPTSARLSPLRSRGAPALLVASVLVASGLAACAGTAAVPPPALPTKPHTAAPSDTEASVTARVDGMLRDAWRADRIAPAPPADDATFLRRAWLDVLGTIPPPDAVLAFEADHAPDKRRRAIDSLLASPRYADRWTDYWEDVLLGPLTRGRRVDREAFRSWLHDAFARDEPWDAVVRDLMGASGANTPQGGGDADGAVNWLLHFDRPEDLAGSVARTFLGVQIQCAECHDHKTEKWTQDDFRRFVAAFAHTRARPEGDPAMKGPRRVVVADVPRAGFAGQRKRPELLAIARLEPRALDGTALEDGGATRDALAHWVTSPHNREFARETVNRMWAHFMGRGFFEPIDDQRPSNPPLAPAVLDWLAGDFVAHGFDLKRLVRIVTSTEAYGLASDGRGAPLWASHAVEPLPREVLLDAILDAAELGPVIERVTGRDLETVRAQLRRRLAFLFDTDEETPPADFDGTVPQTLMLLNGVLVNGAASALPGSALGRVLASARDDADAITTLYLRTLSRRPTDDELARWKAFVAAGSPEPEDDAGALAPAPRTAKQKGGKKGLGPDPLARVARRLGRGAETDRTRAFEDLFWALLDSTEFSFQH